MTAPAPSAAPPRPRATSGLEYLEPPDGSSKWTVHDPGSGRYLRLGGGAVRVLRQLDGDRTVAELTAALTPELSERAVTGLVTSLWTLGLLDGARGQVPAERLRRITFERPLTVRLTLWERPTWLSPGGTMAAVARHPAAGWVAGTAAASGLVALALQAVELRDLATTAPHWSVVAAALALALVVNAVHEVGHGAVLAGAGHAPRRLGVMLFYLCPAMFCDVTDAWRLPQRDQRVRVLLAGPAVQAALAGVLALASIPATGAVGEVVAYASVASYLMATTNLLPFVKLDGYFALSSRLDIPNLQRKSLADLGATSTWLVRGGRRPTLTLSPAWLAFAVASVAFPLVIVGRVLSVVRSVLVGAGGIGAGLWLLFVLVVVVVLGRALTGWWRRIGPVPPGRVVRRLAGPALVVGLALGVVTTPVRNIGAVVVDGGDLELLFLDSPLTPAPTVGTDAELVSLGPLGQRRLGWAEVSTGTRPDVAPLDRFLPVRGIPAPVEVLGVGARPTSSLLGVPTHALVTTSERSLATMVLDVTVGDAYRSLRQCSPASC